MTTQPLPQVRPNGQWPGAINVAQFDRRPDLSAAEQEELAELVARVDAKRTYSTPRARRTLTRLVLPIRAVLEAVGTPKTVYSEVTMTLLREMQQRMTTFWAWAEADWGAMLCAKTQVAAQRRAFTNYRRHLMVVAYVLGGFTDFHCVGPMRLSFLAASIFGRQTVEAVVQQIRQIAVQYGFRTAVTRNDLANAVYELLLVNRSPYLEDITSETLSRLSQRNLPPDIKQAWQILSEALVGLGVIPQIRVPVCPENGPKIGSPSTADIPPEWLEWIERWQATTTVAAVTRTHVAYHLRKTGRWLAHHHPEAVHPAQWTRELAIAYVAAVDRMHVGEWSVCPIPRQSIGTPLTPRGKASHLAALRSFFRDCQEWEWVPRRFDPVRCLATPRSVRALIAPNPRIIADDIWAKLLWAGLNLTAEDLPRAGSFPDKAGRRCQIEPFYPIELIRALVIVWLFTGLRADEIRRLRVGCIRWQRTDVAIKDSTTILAKDAVCMLDVPTNKTGTAFTKPVDPIVGEAIMAWERVRPAQPTALDPKVGEQVSYLFFYRGRQIGQLCLNHTIIPMLCRKAGIPQYDARAPITSHRARSTIASQLFNSKEPMSLFELQEWLGHRSPHSTQYYAKIAPTRLAKAYAEADYFGRNTRMIDVLIDQAAIVSGEASKGLPWKYYDLGHGYCTYDFFEQCEHRMACAQCAFYRPKDAFLELLLEKKAHLLHMQQAIPLSDLELATVAGDLIATEQLIGQLSDRPTPAGPTPRQLEKAQQHTATRMPEAAVQPRSGRERRGEGREGGVGEGVGA
jgi:integrase